MILLKVKIIISSSAWHPVEASTTLNDAVHQLQIKSRDFSDHLRPVTPLYSDGADADMGCNGTAGHCVLFGMDSWLDGDGAGGARPLWSRRGDDHWIHGRSEQGVHLQLSISHSATKFQLRADMVGAGGFSMFSIFHAR